MTGKVGDEVSRCIRAFSAQQGCEIVVLNIQIDPVHLLVLVPPKIPIYIYIYIGTLKGRTAIRVFNKFRNLKHEPYWATIFGLKDIALILLVLMKKKLEGMLKIKKAKKNN